MVKIVDLENYRHYRNGNCGFSEVNQALADVYADTGEKIDVLALRHLLMRIQYLKPFISDKLLMMKTTMILRGRGETDTLKC